MRMGLEPAAFALYRVCGGGYELGGSVTASIEPSTAGAAPAGASTCARISEFARGLHDLAGSDPAAVLAQIPPAAIALIPGTRYAGISGTHGATMRCLCSSDRCVRALDQIQQDHRQGPTLICPGSSASCRWRTCPPTPAGRSSPRWRWR